MNFDLNAFISALIGGGLTIVAVYITLNYENKKNLKTKKDENKELCNKFFMELNYNKRKMIHTISDHNYTLTALDNLHWKNFIYSEASLILSKDKELIDDLATLDSMLDQINNIIQFIKESETVIICNIGHSVVTKDTPKKLRLSLQKYAKDELMPQMKKTIDKLSKLFKNP